MAIKAYLRYTLHVKVVFILILIAFLVAFHTYAGAEELLLKFSHGLPESKKEEILKEYGVEVKKN